MGDPDVMAYEIIPLYKWGLYVIPYITQPTTWMSRIPEVRINGERISGLFHPNSSSIYK